MPKRLEMTLTSSGWETSLGSGCVSLGAIGCEHFVYLVVGQIVVKIVVYLNGRGPAADADAFDFFEREEAISGDAFMADAELVLKMVEEVVTTAQHATDVGADLDVVLAYGLEAKHGIVSGDVAHFKRSFAKAMDDFFDECIG